HRDSVTRRKFLRQVEDVLAPDMRTAQHRGEQSAFADSVGAGDANFRIARDAEMHVLEDSCFACANRRLVEREDLGDGSRNVVDKNRAALGLAKLVLAEF